MGNLATFIHFSVNDSLIIDLLNDSFEFTETENPKIKQMCQARPPNQKFRSSSLGNKGKEDGVPSTQGSINITATVTREGLNCC